MMSSTANNNTTTQATVATGCNQDRPVGTRNRAGTGNWASNEGNCLRLLLLRLLLVLMLLKDFFRRFRATCRSTDSCSMSMTGMRLDEGMLLRLNKRWLMDNTR